MSIVTTTAPPTTTGTTTRTNTNATPTTTHYSNCTFVGVLGHRHVCPEAHVGCSGLLLEADSPTLFHYELNERLHATCWCYLLFINCGAKLQKEKLSQHSIFYNIYMGHQVKSPLNLR